MILKFKEDKSKEVRDPFLDYQISEDIQQELNNC